MFTVTDLSGENVITDTNMKAVFNHDVGCWHLNANIISKNVFSLLKQLGFCRF